MKRRMIPLTSILDVQQPVLMAEIRGNESNPLLHGTAIFSPTPMGGVLIQVEVFYLPDQDLPNHSGFFGMHMHQNGECQIPFDQTGDHFNPQNLMHPEHAGDFPPLLSGHGYAWMAFYDTRLSINDMMGRSIVIHGHKDDFSSQPSGMSGEKIGCGVIIKI